MRRTHMHQGEVAVANPQSLPTSNASSSNGLTAEKFQGLSGIVYKDEDDADIEMWFCEYVNTIWHSLGMCKGTAP